MQAYVTACKLMDLHAFWNILEHFPCIYEYSRTFCIAFWNILEMLEHSDYCKKEEFQLC